MLGLVPRRIIRREVGENDVRSSPADGAKDFEHTSLGIQESGCSPRLDSAYSPLTL